MFNNKRLLGVVYIVHVFIIGHSRHSIPHHIVPVCSPQRWKSTNKNITNHQQRQLTIHNDQYRLAIENSYIIWKTAMFHR